MPRHYKCISGDSHLDIRPERWTPRVPKRWRDRAPRTSGASNLQTFLRITLRLLAPAFLNGWLWVLVHAAKDFSVALLLASAGSVVVANIIYESFVGGHFTSSAAMLVFLITFNLIFVILGRKWIGRTVGA